ncbi:hypothetical protein [Sphingobium aquiterrae]|uniref:hypothetical protein n=1 Tax=Sphingobium aquiterrae TaxID=2038656 RepID=UPI003018F90B
MFKTLIGGLLGGLAMYLIGFVFWGTPLSNLAFSGVDAQTSANLQAALAQGLTPTGSGVYAIPSAASSEGTILYGKGPVALVMFNTGGFPVVDGASLLAGLILALIVGVVFAFALRAVTLDSATRGRAAILFALAAVLWMHIGQPIFNHAPWGYFLYLAFSDFLGLAVAGLIAARFAGRRAEPAKAAPAPAPSAGEALPPED